MQGAVSSKLKQQTLTGPYSLFCMSPAGLRISTGAAPVTSTITVIRASFYFLWSSKERNSITQRVYLHVSDPLTVGCFQLTHFFNLTYRRNVIGQIYSSVDRWINQFPLSTSEARNYISLWEDGTRVVKTEQEGSISSPEGQMGKTWMNDQTAKAYCWL